MVEGWLARPGLAWSCWAVTTLYSALVAAGGRLTADVVGMGRVDPASPPVDIHSVVVLGDGRRRWLVDPYFWVPPIAEPAGDALRPGLWSEAFADGPAWCTAVSHSSGRSVLRHRTFTIPLDAEDVEALCRVSVTFTGVASRPWANVATADGAVAASLDRDGVARVRRWRAGPAQTWRITPEVVVLPDWPAAEAAVAGLALSA
ncbi:MAG TPA: hypothetical protein VK306_11485 [Acidimicrobiales bacterium]|nr:hypothetical protein [Acidimicrobiales bacterium]